MFIILHTPTTEHSTSTHQVVLLSTFRLTVLMIEETFHIEIIEEHEKFLNKLDVSTLDSNCKRSISKSVLLVDANVLDTIDLDKQFQRPIASSLGSIVEQRLPIDILEIYIERLFCLCVQEDFKVALLCPQGIKVVALMSAILFYIHVVQGCPSLKIKFCDVSIMSHENFKVFNVVSTI